MGSRFSGVSRYERRLLKHTEAREKDMPYPRFLTEANELPVDRGNCAFKAFSYGVCDKEIFNKIEEQLKKQNKDPNQVFQNFIEKVATALNIENNWQHITQALFQLKQTNKDKLQVTLAPIMRELAIKQIQNNARQHQARMLPLLQSTFRSYIYEKLGLVIPGEKDDICRRHAFINTQFQQEFDQLKNVLHFTLQEDEYNRLINTTHRSEEENRKLNLFEENLDQQFLNAQQSVLIWWNNKGYQQFLAEMEEPGAWAGDLELAYLGQYFNMNVDITRDGFTHQMHPTYGEIPRQNEQYQLTQDDVRQLVVRQVVDHPMTEDEPLSLLSLKAKDLASRLDAVPECEKVREFIMENSLNLEQQQVSAEWPESCIKELIQRDVINKSTKKFHVDSMIALERIEAMEHKEELQVAWQEAHREPPIVTLTNDGMHWSNIEPLMVQNAGEVAEQPTPPPACELYTATLKVLSMWQSKPKAETWDELIKTVNEPDGMIDYTITTEHDKIIKVSQETQKKLDQALAEKLQLEEYEEYKEYSNRHRN
ncbi:MAG: hypothetical protein A3F11_00145 [Gammaproteobacteria bacterium RIFCSPHIGHO2_12_FULL_37_14]|nr:MAG: hypothetical protein A3F11_00145 [Gammaproteobacteria bacterium RIFCSPHIGHO2_12_FULL_37_14]